MKHPYDVGDRVDIVGPEKEFLVVEQISLLYTVFKRIDSMKMVQVPNLPTSPMSFNGVAEPDLLCPIFPVVFASIASMLSLIT